jgi:alpha-tubulin suppressor-like RCC1 family protein
MIPIKCLQQKINEFTSCDNVTEWQSTGAKNTLTDIVNSFKVSCTALLPLAANHVGKIFYVEDINEHRYSDGSGWRSTFNNEPTAQQGIVYTWGCGAFGLLGNNNTTIDRSSPTSIVGGFTNWCDVAIGCNTAAAIRSDGTLWAWGLNSSGELGIGATTGLTSVLSPVSVLGGFTDWCAVDVGNGTVVGLRNNGTLWSWGLGFNGYLGSNSTNNRSSPGLVAGGFTDWCQVSAHGGHTAAVRCNGTLWAWGGNFCGSLGDGTETNKSSPVSVIGEFIDWCQVNVGCRHTVATRQNGTMWAWGLGEGGQLGNGIAKSIECSYSSPVSVIGGFTDWCSTTTGNQFALGLRSNGVLYAWGIGACGRLGDGTNNTRSSPVSVIGGFTDWCQISVGGINGTHSLAVRTNGTIWAWGCNCAGRLGDGTILDRSSPVSVVGGFTDWCQASAGSSHSLGLRSNGVLYAWGVNSNGRLGDGTITSRSSPVSVVGGFTDWCQASAGAAHNLALRCNGTLWGWGQNFGELGDNTNTSKCSPVSVVGGFTDWCQASAGSGHSLAVRCNGTLWSWGRNNCGILGNNTTVSRSSPVSVIGGFTDWCQASAGYNHSLAVRTNGTLWAWGSNYCGVLADGTTINRSSPVSVIGGFTDWCLTIAGSTHTLAIRANGTLWGWGRNLNGTLGRGYEVVFNRCSPVSVVGGFTDWCQGSAGAQHSLGIRRNGTLWAWGCNVYGRLGDNTVVHKSSPVSVVGGFTDWCQTSAGSCHSAAVRMDGTAWTWGVSRCGRLGDGANTDRSSPVLVRGDITSWCCIDTTTVSTIGLQVKNRGV